MNDNELIALLDVTDADLERWGKNGTITLPTIRRLSALSSALRQRLTKVQGDEEIITALRRGFTVCRSGIAGEPLTRVEISFHNLRDAQIVHQWLGGLVYEGR